MAWSLGREEGFELKSLTSLFYRKRGNGKLAVSENSECNLYSRIRSSPQGLDYNTGFVCMFERGLGMNIRLPGLIPPTLPPRAVVAPAPVTQKHAQLVSHPLLRFGASPEAIEAQRTFSKGINRRDIDMVRAALQTGLCDPNRLSLDAVDSKDLGRPLMDMIAVKQTAIVELLLQHNADPNAKHAYSSRTALMEAVMVGGRDIVRLLLAHGADMNATGYDNSNVLHMVGFHNRLDLYHEFFRGKVPLNPPGQRLGSALYLAVKQRNGAVARQFIADGADLTFKDASGLNLLHVAVERGDLDLSRFLIQSGLDINEVSAYNSTPLAIATLRGPQMTKLLLQAGADVNYPTCLQFAVSANNPEVLNLIIRHPQFIWNPATVRNALTKAITMNNPDAFNKLVPHCADINEPEDSKSAGTLLMDAAATSRCLMLEELLARGADVHRENVTGQTALLSAINQTGPRREVLEVVRTLLEKGADPNKMDNFKITPLIRALMQKNFEVAELLLDKSATVTTPEGGKHNPMFLAIQTCNPVLVERMLRLGGTIPVRSETQMNPLSWLQGFLKLQKSGLDEGGLTQNLDIQGTIDLLTANGAEPADAESIAKAFKQERERSEDFAFPF